MKNKMIVKNNVQVAGVYVMKDIDGTIRYVGSGISCADRLSSHLYYLKRNLYAGTNKQVLQDIYDRGELTFEVIKVSASNKDVTNMDSKQKEALQEALAVLEQFYYNVNKVHVCNKMTKIKKWSTSPTKETTELRRRKNTGVNNPNIKYDEELISNIVYLKDKGLKPREIVELLTEQDIDVHGGYISQIGVYKWINLEGKCPEWYEEDKIAN